MIKQKSFEFSMTKALKHFFIPHKSNDYRPHAIRWQGLVLTALISLVTHMSYVYLTTGQVGVLGKSVNIDINKLASDTNNIRKSNNLDTLVVDQKLNLAAQQKAEDMIKNNYWSHDSPLGKNAWEFLNQSGFKYEIAGENLAKNYPDSNSILDAWMASETHRQNILNPKFNSVGFATAEGVIGSKITTIIVAYYAKKSNFVSSSFNDKAEVLGVSKTDFINNPITYLGYTIKNLSPVTIGTIFFLIGLIFVAFVSHIFREYMPKKLQRRWNRHHGLFKAALITFIVIIIFISSSSSSI